VNTDAPIRMNCSPAISSLVNRQRNAKAQTT